MSYLVGDGVDGQTRGAPPRHDAVHPQRLRLQRVGSGRLKHPIHPVKLQSVDKRKAYHLHGRAIVVLPKQKTMTK